ncbi:MAG TPA: tryptophan 2,3-dioxygenase family protein [Chloroflexota bacterium]|nr:tryptophan 2,3-dioxygenase family protein [Chloroflexota bacterium]
MSEGRLTYGDYLAVPQLLALQHPLSEPPVHGEMLFIVVQQAQELWFKQLLHELHLIVRRLTSGALEEAAHVLDRVNRILGMLAEGVEILEALPPSEFQQFRPLLETASGFESQQFRELEVASGLEDRDYLRMAGRIADVPAIRRRWPVTLRDAFLSRVRAVAPDPVTALVEIYAHPSSYPDLYRLCESVSDYELRFRQWRFHHAQLVMRVIGDRSPGTTGTPGSAYLDRTLQYRFFPELWEARNKLVSAAESAHGG